MRKFALVLSSFALALSLTSATANPLPDEPIGFCLPDLDGHCWYCEVDLKPTGMRCVSH